MQATVSHQMWVLEMKLGSSGGAAGALSRLSSSPAQSAFPFAAFVRDSVIATKRGGSRSLGENMTDPPGFVLW